MRLTILCLLLSLSVKAIPGINIINTSLTKPDSSILYSRCNNILKITGGTNVDYQLITTDTTDIKITKDSINTYTVWTRKTDSYDTLYVVYKGQVIHKEVFHTKLLGANIFYTGNTLFELGECRGGIASNSFKISLVEFLENPFIHLRADNYYKESQIELISFDFSCSIRNQYIAPIPCPEGNFPASVIALLKKMEPGGRIYIDNMWVNVPGMGKRLLPTNLVITVN